MIRLIAIDMDGTMLSPDHSISERNIKAVQQAQAKGIEVLIATGRSFPEADDPVTSAGLELGFICLNGAEVRDQSKNVVSATHLLKDDVTRAITVLESEEIHHELFIDDIIYTTDVNQQINMFVQFARSIGQSPDVEAIREEIMERARQGFIREIDSYDEIIQEHGNVINKVFGTTSDLIALANAREALNTIPGLSVTASGERNIEINSINAQKGIALEEYAKRKGISMENVMAIGDSYNDLSMLKKAGRSVAMENAPADIKAICSHTTATNEHDGVALAIEAIF
jgi:Cof subfamily protein (haloacid dehalogenase superfamily)